jgi:outer membrane protein assembly factor BamA
VIFVTVVAMTVFVPFVATAQERIAEIRVHGNHTTPDAEVISLSGLHAGEEANDARLAEATRLLHESGRFEDVDVRRRYLSIADPSRILIMLVVEEQPGVSEDHPISTPWRRVRASTMWLPILSYADGYGFTYGARMTFVNALGPRTRASVPLSWGGERRAGAEVERLFGGANPGTGPPALSLRGALSVYRRVNPYYEVPDTRLEARVRAEHALTSWLRAGAAARTAQVTFGSDTLAVSGAGVAIAQTTDRHDAFGGDVTFDTRLDPAFPRNAVYASLGLERLAFSDAVQQRVAARRGTADLRGYVGLGPTIVGVRGLVMTSDVPLPRSEHALLGGSDTLRGYDAGHAANDNLAAISTEVRLPITSPLSVGRFGVKGFVDWGTTWSAGARLADQRWERGIGGGVYFGAGPLIADFALAWPEHGGPRGHFGLGVSF